MRLNDAAERNPARNRQNSFPCFKRELVTHIKAQMPAEGALADALVLFTALADPTRLRIVHALMHAEELCVCDVAHVLGMSIASASHHLRKLREMKMLKHRTAGKMAYYSLRDRLVADMLRYALLQALP